MKQTTNNENKTQLFSLRSKVGNVSNKSSKDNASFLDLARKIVKEKKDDKYALWCDSNGKVAKEYTFGELWDEAGMIAHSLRNEWGLEKGDKAILCYNFGLHFFASFLGCLRAGVTAVLVYPPNPSSLKLSLTKMNEVIEDCNPKCILCDSKVHGLRRFDQGFNIQSKTSKLWPEMKFTITDNLISTKNNGINPLNVLKKKKTLVSFDEDTISPEDVAFLQYTSGSTGEPKGVMITFAALVANVNLLSEGFAGMYKADGGIPSNGFSGCSWLPQYHDLGLVVGNIVPFINGWCMHMMSPLTFINNPLLWIEIMSRNRISWGVAPDFAFHLVARKFNEKKERMKKCPIPELDLSCIGKIQVCAEPVRVNTKAAFDDLFAEYGLRDDWFVAGYGLAEHVVGASWYSGLSLSCPRDEDATSLVAVGCRQNMHSSLTMKVVDPVELQEVNDGETGELWISGPSVAAGYLGKGTLTKELLFAKLTNDSTESKYLRTGDLAFFQNDKLFICGRIKDLIIVNGVNYYPQDIEYAVQDASTAVRPGCVAAFSTNDTNGDGSLEVVFEIRRGNEKDARDIVNFLRVELSQRLGLVSSRIVAIKEKTILKTTSGKIRRRATRSALHDGSLDIVCEWKKSTEIIKKSGKATGVLEDISVLAKSLPVNDLPEGVDVIYTIKADSDRLDGCFRALRLTEIDKIARAWECADKSTSAMQAMCKTSLGALLRHYPSAVQFAHLVAKNPDWVLGDGMDHLIDIVHCAFVLEWATKELVADVNLLKEKVHVDAQYETSLTDELGLDYATLPEDARFLVGGKSHDALFGRIDLFAWMKSRANKQMLDCIISSVSDNITPNEGEMQQHVILNVLMAIWEDRNRGFHDNVSVGNWIAARSELTREQVKEEIYQACFKEKDWSRLYLTWNMAFVSKNNDTSWLLAKLLIPCVVNSQPDEFVLYRTVALYLVLQLSIEQLLKNGTTPGILSPSASLAYGRLNKYHAFRLSFDTAVDWDNSIQESPPQLEHRNWLDKFNKWAGKGNDKDWAKDRATGYGHDDFDNIMMTTFGSNFDSEKTWEELGLTSMMSVELRDAISQAFSITLSPDAFGLHQTPACLKSYIMNNQGTPLERILPELPRSESTRLSWPVMGAIQIVGVILLLLLFAFSIVPAYYIGNWVTKINSAKWIALSLAPAAIVTWMLSFSLVTVLVKWIVIGRYKEVVLCVPSVAYVQWWFVDRAVDMWECWVGKYVKNTPLAHLFYWLMGATIHPSAKVNAFIREFDLVSIGRQASVEYQHIRCHKFGQWEGDHGPTIRLRSVMIGDRSCLKGMASPGTRMSEGAYVEKQSVLPEGAQVPSDTLAVGNPAFALGKAQTLHEPCWWKLGTLKMIWLLFELYHFSAVFYVGQTLLEDRFPVDWRYSKLCHWFFLISITSLLSVGSSIIVKWILIGRRKAGRATETLLRHAADWAADFHYHAATSVLYSVSSRSGIWNAILMLHGMDIDLESRCFVDSFVPSMVDLVSVKRSLISTVSFDTKSDGEYHRVKVNESSIGWGVRVGPGLSISRAVIAPLTHVTENVVRDTLDKRNTLKPLFERFVGEAAINIGYITVYILILLSLIPSYELWMTAFKPSTVWTVVPVLSMILVLQTTIWMVLLAVIQSVALLGSRGRKQPWNTPLYMIYHSTIWSIQNWSFLRVLYGSPACNLVLRFLGTTIKGRALLLPTPIYEFPKVTIADKTVVDRAKVNGHYTVFDQTTLGPCIISGVLHEGTLATADTVLTENESGPWRTYLAAAPDSNNDRLPVEVETQDDMIVDIEANCKVLEQRFSGEKETPHINSQEVFFDIEASIEVPTNESTSWNGIGHRLQVYVVTVSVLTVLNLAVALTAAIFARGLLQIAWQWVCIAILVFTMINVFMKNALFTLLRRLLLKRWGRFTEGDVVDIESSRWHLASTWLDDILTTDARKKAVRFIDVVCRKGGHIYINGLNYLVILPYIIGHNRTTEAAVAGTIVTSTTMLLMCASIWCFRSMDDVPRWQAWTYLFGASDRIRDGRFGQLNNVFATLSSSLGRTIVLVVAYFALPQESENVHLWDLASKLVFLPLLVGDALGEIIGTSFGRHTFRVLGLGEINRKSVEGCIAVFLGSFVSTLSVTLSKGSESGFDISTWTRFGLPLALALVTMVTETISFRSTDNAVIPVCNALVFIIWRATMGIEH